jgi:hypothetical protein
MTSFEEQLKQAMTRQEPPAGFTSRVLTRIEQEQIAKREPRLGTWLGAMRGRGLAGTMAALLVLSGSLAYQRHEQAARGRAAKEKLLVAMRIAGVKLYETHRRVLEVEAEEVRQ